MAYWVKVEECLVVLSLWGHSFDCVHVFIFRQMKMGKRGDHWGTCIRRREMVGGFRRGTITCRCKCNRVNYRAVLYVTYILYLTNSHTFVIRGKAFFPSSNLMSTFYCVH